MIAEDQSNLRQDSVPFKVSACNSTGKSNLTLLNKHIRQKQT